jgi:hypothetical protein
MQMLRLTLAVGSVAAAVPVPPRLLVVPYVVSKPRRAHGSEEASPKGMNHRSHPLPILGLREGNWRALIVVVA